MEEQIDSEMKKMEDLDEDDIEAIRQRRLKAMQKAHAAKQVFIPILQQFLMKICIIFPTICKYFCPIASKHFSAIFDQFSRNL